MKEINGISMLEFELYGSCELENVSFAIKTDEGGFFLDCKNCKSAQENLLKLYERRETKEFEFLFCQDENGVDFTLFNCEVSVSSAKGNKVTGLYVAWDSLIYGLHSESKAALFPRKLLCVAEDNTKTYGIYIGKHEYAIKNGEIDAIIQCEEIEENGKLIRNFKRLDFELIPKSENALNLTELEEAFYRLLELYFLYLGSFAFIDEIRFIFAENEKEVAYYTGAFNRYKSLPEYSRAERVLEPVKKSKNNFSAQYDKWAQIKAKNAPLFEVFKNNFNNKNIDAKAQTSLFIQCLEGYFRANHMDDSKNFPDSVRRKILREIGELVKNSDEIRKIIDLYNQNDANKSMNKKVLKGVGDNLARINYKTSAELIEAAIYFSPFTKKLFEYEIKHFYNEDKKIELLSRFINEAAKRGDFLACARDEKDCFVTLEENYLAQDKFEVLLRLIVLQDAGFSITEESLDINLLRINERYKKIGKLT